MAIDRPFSDEQQAYRDALRREADTPELREMRTDGHTTHHSFDLWRTLGSAGLLAPSVEEEFGGGAAGVVEEMILLEELMRQRVPIGAYPVSAAVLDSSDRSAYLDSLAVLRELDFDVLVPWAAPAGERCVEVVHRSRARDQIDAVMKRVSAGESR